MRRFLVVLMLVVVCPVVAEGEITIEKSDAGAIVKSDGKLFAEYVTRSGNKPILWPIVGPTGKAMSRSWPMNEDAPDYEKKDHPHHRSFWFTHGDVNGVDFWSEGNRAGRIVHREFVKLDGAAATIVAKNDWLDNAGKKVCEEEQTLHFGGDANRRWIDVDIVVTASEGDLVFGDTKEGSFGVRVPETMKVEAKQGGKIINSEGQTDGETWGKPAAWVDYHGPVEGEHLGIAIFNHPKSFRYPTPWHVRTYGLFAANPFGLRDFAGGNKNVSGAHTVPKGKTLTLRYGVVLHKGDEKDGGIAELFAKYAKKK